MQEPSVSSPQPGPSPPVAETRTAAKGLALSPLSGLIIGLFAGLMAAGLMQWPRPYPWFANEGVVKAGAAQAGPPSGESEEEKQARHAAIQSNTMFAVGLLGVLLGGLLGAGEGVARKSIRSVLMIGTVGLLLGALFGCLGGWLGHRIYVVYENDWSTSELTRTFLIQAATMAPLGLGIALALGIFSRRPGTVVRCLIGGVLAGALTALIYGVLVAVLFATAQTKNVVPEGAGFDLVGALLLWACSATVLVGLIIPAMGEKQKPRPDTAPSGDSQAAEASEQ